MLAHPVHQAEFLLTVANDEQLPPPGPPEIAFAGRSNAGKSSALNALANRSRLAFTSKTPGRTQQINFFRLRNGALLADLPGYGYAAVPKALKRHWQDFLGRYVAARQIARRPRVDRRCATWAFRSRPQAAVELFHKRPAGARSRDKDRQARDGGAACGKAHDRARDIAAAFPCTRRRVAVVAFSATRRIGIEEAEARARTWLGESSFDAREMRRPKPRRE